MVPEETDNMCRRTAGQKGFVRNEKSNFQYRSGAPADSGGRRLCRQYAGLLGFHAVFQRLVDSDYYYTLYCKYHLSLLRRLLVSLILILIGVSILLSNTRIKRAAVNAACVFGGVNIK